MKPREEGESMRRRRTVMQRKHSQQFTVKCDVLQVIINNLPEACFFSAMYLRHGNGTIEIG